LPAGLYEIPFSFILPHNVPSSFNYTFSKFDREQYARVDYKITAYVKSNAGDIVDSNQNLKISKKLLIRQSPVDISLSSALQPKVTQKVKTLCCIPRGQVKLGTDLRAVIFSAGKISQVFVDVDNSKSSEDIISV